MPNYLSRRRQAAKGTLWRDPKAELPDANIMVLLLVDQDDDPAYVTAGYDSGSVWRDAVGARPIHGHVRGWMPMDEALSALSRTERKGAARG